MLQAGFSQVLHAKFLYKCQNCQLRQPPQVSKINFEDVERRGAVSLTKLFQELSLAYNLIKALCVVYLVLYCQIYTYIPQKSVQ